MTAKAGVARRKPKVKVGFREKVPALLRDPNFRLRMYRSGWEETANPIYAWEAIAACAEHEKPLPDWIISYLADVAERMTSDEARASTDLRAILPGIMGFSTKPGPGRLLDPDDDSDDKLLFAIRFAIEIEKGKKPSQALRDASTNVLSADLRVDDRTLLRWSNADDRTLRGWVKKVLDLPPQNAPRTNAEWKAVLRRHFEHFYLFAEQEFRQEFRKTPPR